MKTYTINPKATDVQCIGVIPEVITKTYNLNCPSNEVLMYPGVIKHIRKSKHESTFLKHYDKIPDIISNPDYVGQNPKEPNSVELYKFINEYLLVAIKLDPSGYFFLSSFYDLNNGQYKIQSRLNSGRIVPFSSLS